jgi:hypothetical protein
MSSDRQRPDDPLQQALPEIKGKVHALAPQEIARTLAQQLVPVVDEIRQLATDFGIRPYRVFLVHIAWTGPSRGMGAATEISRREILPTPEVADMSATDREMHALGLTEAGGIRLRKVTASLTEDDLLGRTPDLRAADGTRTEKRSVEFFYEVVQQRPGGLEPAVRRRYVPDSAADLRPALAGWTISLRKQQADRARDGAMSRSRL